MLGDYKQLLDKITFKQGESMYCYNSYNKKFIELTCVSTVRTLTHYTYTTWIECKDATGKTVYTQPNSWYKTKHEAVRNSLARLIDKRAELNTKLLEIENEISNIFKELGIHSETADSLE